MRISCYTGVGWLLHRRELSVTEVWAGCCTGMSCLLHRCGLAVTEVWVACYTAVGWPLHRRGLARVPLNTEGPLLLIEPTFYEMTLLITKLTLLD